MHNTSHNTNTKATTQMQKPQHVYEICICVVAYWFRVVTFAFVLLYWQQMNVKQYSNINITFMSLHTAKLKYPGKVTITVITINNNF